MTDWTSLWDFDDPSASERRLRAAAEGDPGGRDVMLTQVARALGLQQRYDDAAAILDAIVSDDPEVTARRHLERGRLLRSSGSPAESRPHFERAAAVAATAGQEALQIDALHMLALVAEPEQALAITADALALARAATEQAAIDWDASLLNNLGMTHADAGDFEAALPLFEEALAARERIGDRTRTRVARWMIGWCLRELGRPAEALRVQRELKADLDSTGDHDPYVDEELALLEAGQTRR
ncbi:MAG: tetratricopeptide repeat protein [Actinobacteria bacterium]|uniref:Unannotated protein n=1 Tax=freshwater metagenome TaxID=449393 RepID=A0A6J6QFS9_9ZZZZ|nr:tetratricopeptide repeat protein [Actinomycetota bacterium]